MTILLQVLVCSHRENVHLLQNTQRSGMYLVYHDNYQIMYATYSENMLIWKQVLDLWDNYFYAPEAFKSLSSDSA